MPIVVDGSPSFLTLDEVKAQTNITGTVDDAELTPLLKAARDVVERHTGKIVEPRAFTEEITAEARTYRLRLAKTPVTGLTSVTNASDGTVYDLTGAVVRASGLVVLKSTVSGYLDVVYTAGLADVPESYVEAGAIIVEHLWELQRGAMPPVTAMLDDSIAVPGLGYAIPNRALELLGPRPPVVA